MNAQALDADLKKHAERYGTASAERVKIVLPVTSKFDYDNQRERYYDANGQELWPDDLIEALNAAPSAPSSAAENEIRAMVVRLRGWSDFGSSEWRQDCGRAADLLERLARAPVSATAEKIIEDYIGTLVPGASGITHLQVVLNKIRRADR